jgi:hypothetical protein
VDVVFSDAPDTEPPAVAAATPPSNATDVPLAPSITVRFTEGMDPATINTQTFELRSAGGAVAGEVTYDAAALTARLTPAAPLAPGTRYTVQVAGGAGAAVMRDVAGNALAGDVSWDFDTTTVTTTCPCTLWPPDAVPAVVDAGPDGSVELGVRFSSVENGFIRGIRFYKSAGNLGPHVVSLWTAGGALLAQATSAGGTASGWQEVAFDVPVAITSGLTYVASYHVSGGHYSYSSQYFTSPRSRGPLLAPAASAGGNGVFAYGASSLFPTGTHNATNYWVDVVFSRD